jgi:hypothetical protein
MYQDEGVTTAKQGLSVDALQAMVSDGTVQRLDPPSPPIGRPTGNYQNRGNELGE